MTKSDKQSIKMTINRLNQSYIGFSVLGAIGMFTGMGLMFLSAKTQHSTGLEVPVFALGAVLLIIAMLLSTRSLRFEKKLGDYRKDLFLKKDKLYYDRCCSHAKNNEMGKSVFYHNLIKNNIFKDISFGFMLGRMYGSTDTKEYNDFIDKYKSDLN